LIYLISEANRYIGRLDEVREEDLKKINAMGEEKIKGLVLYE
jgi:hypothetical protein